jgi:glycosyltransferase involved in cell wall biosynthesis
MIRDATNPGPLVTVLVPTFNRRRYLPAALTSVTEQSYTNLQVIVVNDGGASVRDIVRSLNDPRVLLLERRDNRGKAHSLNQAISYAEGKYVAYLDDDDIYYPNHVAALVDLLEGDTGCGAAYSDLYKTHCRVLEDGRRQVLGKVVNISRDFDRWFLFHFNHVLHVSLMHRRDLLDSTGPYNESVRVLIDWDMTRRLAFYTDFAHTNEITGEFFGPVGECDRISYRMRLDETEYLRNVLTIRTTRPPKPWPKVKDTSIVFLADAIGRDSGTVMRDIWAKTFVPYELYLPLPAEELARLGTEMPNVIPVPTPAGASKAQRLAAALARAGGDYAAVIGQDLAVEHGWLMPATYALSHTPEERRAVRLPSKGAGDPPAVYRAGELREAINRHGDSPIPAAVRKAGIELRDPPPGEYPCLFDDMLKLARSMRDDGKPLQAARTFEEIGRRFGNTLWMKRLEADACFVHGGCDGRALGVCARLNATRPTVDSLLIEARLHRRADRMDRAIDLLRTALGHLRERG